MARVRQAIARRDTDTWAPDAPRNEPVELKISMGKRIVRECSARWPAGIFIVHSDGEFPSAALRV
jgi:hypothetical protein